MVCEWLIAESCEWLVAERLALAVLYLGGRADWWVASRYLGVALSSLERLKTRVATAQEEARWQEGMARWSQATRPEAFSRAVLELLSI